jgi:hypothetical protein
MKFHKVERSKGRFVYPQISLSRKEILGVKLNEGNVSNMGGSILLLTNGEKIHINESLMKVLEMLGLSREQIDAFDEAEETCYML